jgi:ribonuclease HI
VLHEFLPAKDILNRRHIEPTGFCEVCGADRESIKHVLTECTIAKLFWREVRVRMGVKLPRLHPVTWASDLLSDGLCSEKDRCLFIIGMYSLWLQRNGRRHGTDQPPLWQAVRWAVDTAHDLWQITKVPRLKPVAGTRAHWRAPQEGWIKCNTDGAFYPDSGQGATVVVLWDSAGTFVGGRARWQCHGLDALMMEALACKDGVTLANERGIRHLVVEIDSQELVKMWEMMDSQRACISPILRDIRALSAVFVNLSLVYTNRSCNQVAHTLAKQVSNENRLGEWQSAPPCIFDLMTEDCNHVSI